MPEVLDALVRKVPGHIGCMKPRHLANSLQALVVLEEQLSMAELPGIAAVAVPLKRSLPDIRGKDLFFDVPMALWVCAKLEACAIHWRSRCKEGASSDFLDRLESEIAQRGLREEKVLATKA